MHAQFLMPSNILKRCTNASLTLHKHFKYKNLYLEYFRIYMRVEKVKIETTNNQNDANEAASHASSFLGPAHLIQHALHQ